MTSTTAILPLGPMREWCLTGFDSGPHDPFWDLCANTTRGHESDFTSICCDGEVIDTSVGLFGTDAYDATKIDLADMVCCRQAGKNPGGLLPLPADYTHCASGDPTPLASMAATNTDNAQNFAVTYISALAGTADWTTRSTPTCLWVNTKNVSATTEVTLPAAKITTLPPESSDVYFTGSAVYSLSGSSSLGPNATAQATGKPTSGASQTASEGAASAGSQSASSSTEPAGNAGSSLTTAEWSPALLMLLLLTTMCQVLKVI